LKIPKITWDDVGGLTEAKKQIRETVLLSRKYAHMLNPKLGRKTGILFYGPPGTGKTLMAKCVANECGLPFFSVKGPELLNMYVGESEKNLRQVFEKVRRIGEGILFFDEIDALLPSRGNGSDGGGVTDRLVAQFLTEMDLCMNSVSSPSKCINTNFLGEHFYYRSDKQARLS
jgi:SpoVK/Ycf46/Vps4 family AAA+-type ATPase